jgi:hypothetical protein
LSPLLVVRGRAARFSPINIVGGVDNTVVVEIAGCRGGEPFVGAHIKRSTVRPRVAFEVDRRRERRGTGVDGGSRGKQVEVADRVHKELSGRRVNRIHVLARGRAPLRERLIRAAAVGGEPRYHGVVVARKPREAVLRNINGASRGGQTEQDVVADSIIRAAVLNVERPAGVGSHVDRVVDDDVVRRTGAPIDTVQRNAAGVIVVQQVVFDARILHAIHIDAAAAAGLTLRVDLRVVVDDVSTDDGVRNDSVAAEAGIAVHVDAVATVVENGIVADHWPITAVGNVNAVLNG